MNQAIHYPGFANVILDQRKKIEQKYGERTSNLGIIDLLLMKTNIPVDRSHLSVELWSFKL